MPRFSKFIGETSSLGPKSKALPKKEVPRAIPEKLNDPGTFSIPCTINGVHVKDALCDLGAAISVITYPVAQRLGLTSLKPPINPIQFADGTSRMPAGIAEDVLVKVGKRGHTFKNDFVVMHLTSDSDISVILGRPFLATSGAWVDVKHGAISFTIGKERVIFRKRSMASSEGGQGNVAHILSSPLDCDDIMLATNPNASVSLCSFVGEGGHKEQELNHELDHNVRGKFKLDESLVDGKVPCDGQIGKTLDEGDSLFVQVSRGRNGKEKTKFPYEYLRSALFFSKISLDDSLFCMTGGCAQVSSALLRLLTLKDPP